MNAVPESGPVKTVQLKDKIIAITGANRGTSYPFTDPKIPIPATPSLTKPTTNDRPGIGLGIADCCLSNGASKIYSIDIGETGDDFAAVSKKYPGQIFAIQADVTKEESVQAAVDKILEEAGGLHGM
ncbi:hypothetical protein N0V95_004853, partial [Ascochyta clinopodiicola]